jgi:hypothetical protein
MNRRAARIFIGFVRPVSALRRSLIARDDLLASLIRLPSNPSAPQ